MNRKVLLTGLLTVALLAPVSEAHAQGWPTFDVAKLASLISNLIGRFQPIPQVLSRVNQVKTTIAQVQAVGQAALSGDLKAVGKAAAAGLQDGAFGERGTALFEKAAKGNNGATDATKKIKETLFSLKSAAPSQEERDKVSEARDEIFKKVSSEKMAKALYLAVNGTLLSAERFKKADEAMKNAETVQDSVNANTLMIMAGNYEKMNQISLQLSELKKITAAQIKTMPVGPRKKPVPVKNLKIGDFTYSDEEKDEIDVKF